MRACSSFADLRHLSVLSVLDVTMAPSTSYPAGMGKYNMAHRWEQRSLLIAVNCVAALSIFFFG